MPKQPVFSAVDMNRRYTPDGNPESHFRQRIRDILGLDWSTRDEKIYDELRRLKKQDGDL